MARWCIGRSGGWSRSPRVVGVRGSDVAHTCRRHRLHASNRRQRQKLPAVPCRGCSAEACLARCGRACDDAFLRTYRRDGKGPLYASLPAGHARSPAVNERMRKIRIVMAREGISLDRLQVRSKGGSHSIRISYDQIAAIPPDCGDWSEDVTFNPEKLPYPNYGCASQRNLAAMVANPSDVAFPAREVERQSDRRSTVYKSFTSTTPATTAIPTR